MMDIIIHDLEAAQFDALFPKREQAVRVISDTGKIHPCIGCFNCWVKTPGKCIIKDGYENLGILFSQAEHITVISKCVYGGFSPFVKNVFDRGIAFLLPFFERKQGKTRHQARYDKEFCLDVKFYGNATSSKEKELARSLIEANCFNYHVSQCSVEFFDSPEQLAKEALI